MSFSVFTSQIFPSLLGMTITRRPTKLRVHSRVKSSSFSIHEIKLKERIFKRTFLNWIASSLHRFRTCTHSLESGKDFMLRADFVMKDFHWKNCSDWISLIIFLHCANLWDFRHPKSQQKISLYRYKENVLLNWLDIFFLSILALHWLSLNSSQILYSFERILKNKLVEFNWLIALIREHLLFRTP